MESLTGPPVVRRVTVQPAFMPGFPQPLPSFTAQPTYIPSQPTFTPQPTFSVQPTFSPQPVVRRVTPGTSGLFQNPPLLSGAAIPNFGTLTSLQPNSSTLQPSSSTLPALRPISSLPSARVRSPIVRLPGRFTIPESLGQTLPPIAGLPSVQNIAEGSVCCVCTQPLSGGGCEQAICGSCVTPGPFSNVGLNFGTSLPSISQFGGGGDVTNLIELVKSLYVAEAVKSGLSQDAVQGDAARFAELFRPTFNIYQDLTQDQVTKIFNEFYDYYSLHQESTDELQNLISRYSYRLAISMLSLNDLMAQDAETGEWGL